MISILYSKAPSTMMTNTLLGQNDHYDQKVQQKGILLTKLYPNHRSHINKQVEHFSFLADFFFLNVSMGHKNENYFEKFKH